MLHIEAGAFSLSHFGIVGDKLIDSDIHGKKYLKIMYNYVSDYKIRHIIECGQTKSLKRRNSMKKYYKIVIAVSIILVAGFILIPEKEKNGISPASVAAATVSERISYFALHGWEVEEMFSKNITIPSQFSESYESFAEIQDKQRLPLREYKGKDAVLYTYRITNYNPDNKNLLAELIVCDDIAVSSIIYAEDDTEYILSVQ